MRAIDINQEAGFAAQVVGRLICPNSQTYLRPSDVIPLFGRYSM